MNTLNKALFWCYFLIIAIALPMAGAVAKIMHLPFADILLTLSVIIQIPCVIYALYHLFSNNHYSKAEKIVLLICFIFLSPLTMLLYLWFAPEKQELQRLREEQKLTI
jgi:hypothetical protein